MTVATTADICLREIRNSLSTLQREKDSKSNELDESTRELTVYREKKEGFDDIAKQLESKKNDIVKDQNKYNAGMSEIKNCIKKVGGYKVNADDLEKQFEKVAKNEAASHMYSYVYGLFADAIEKTRSKSCNDEQNQLKEYCCDDLAFFNFDFARPKLFKKYSGNWKKEVENNVPQIIKIISDSAVKRAEELAQVKTAEFDNIKIDVNGRIKSNITACAALETKIKEYETRCEDIEKNLDEYTECIAKKQESEKNVKAVFVKHANGKLEEIGTRIFKEQDGRVQTALFLTACMIYGDLKKYYKEDYE